MASWVWVLGACAGTAPPLVPAVVLDPPDTGPIAPTGDTAEPPEPSDADYRLATNSAGIWTAPATGLLQTPQGPRVVVGSWDHWWVVDPSSGVDQVLAAADARWIGPRRPLVVVPDVDGDGTDDLWTGGGTPTLLSGASDQPLASIRGGLDSFGGPRVVALAAADLDADGLGDLVSGDGTTGAVAWWDGVVAGHRDSPTALWTGSSPTMDLTALGDLTGDGAAEVLVADDRGDAWLISDPSPGYAPIGDVALAHLTAGIEASGSGDLDGDGVAELVLTTAPRTTWIVSPAAGEIALGATADIRLESPVDVDRSSLAIGDLDGDGHLDLAVGAHTVETLRGLGVLWVLHGPFAHGGTIDLDTAGSPRDKGPNVEFATDLTAGDLDGDGTAELLVSGSRGVGGSHSLDRRAIVWVYVQP